MIKNSTTVLTVILILAAILSGCTAGGAANGNTVQVHYTGKLADGTVFDSSSGRDPLEFTLGKDEMIPGFEKAVLGMKVGEKKTVTIASQDAYGPRFDNRTSEVSRDKLPPGLNPQVGQQLQTRLADGSTIVVTVTKVSATTITIDGNHPLAGKDLTFEIELVKIK